MNFRAMIVIEGLTLTSSNNNKVTIVEAEQERYGNKMFDSSSAFGAIGAIPKVDEVKAR